MEQELLRPEAASNCVADALIDSLERQRLETHGLMVMQHGVVLAQARWRPYDASQPHLLYSLSKSFAATAAGLAIAEGRLGLDDLVVDHFSSDLPPEISPNLANMQIRHLLSMSCGHESEPPRSELGSGGMTWVKSFLAHPVPFEPGTHFCYNSASTYMVAAALQAATGQTLLEYLQPRLFDPLGIAPPTWESSPQGINVGGWGLSLPIEAIAKFGQLYLDDGVWKGSRLLPEGWVAQATQKQVENGEDPNSDWTQGYGFQFWRSRHGYRGDGAFGQFCIVLPEQGAVVAITGGGGDMQATLDAVWQELLPRLDECPEGRGGSLMNRMLPPSNRGATPAWREGHRAYRLDGHGTLRLEWNDERAKVGFLGGEIVATFDDWLPNETSVDGWAGAAAAARAEWVDPLTLRIKVCRMNSPQNLVVSLHLSNESVAVDVENRGILWADEGFQADGVAISS